MKIQLSDHFNYRRLLMFAMPSISMMIFSSIYGVIDGLFVSNYVGKTAFAAVNFIMPVIMILGAVGSVFGSGGSALVAKTLGEGNKDKANRLFSLFIYSPAFLGTVVAVLGIIFIPDIAAFLGAKGEMLKQCIIYGRLLMLSMPAYMLQYAFQSFFVTAEKPQLGFVITVAAGVTNIILDVLFIAVFDWGVAGAALATAAGELVGGLVPCIYFCRNNSSLLSLGRTVIDSRALLKAGTNGSSEFVSNISMSLVGMLYNIQLLRYIGEDGVAAYGVLMYISFAFIAILFGYAMGTAPIFAYNYGAQNHDELRNLLKKSLFIISVMAIILFSSAEIFARPFAMIFVGYDIELMELTVSAFRIYSFSFLIAGFNVFGSSFFTALNNGLISAFISFMRTLVFEVAAVLLLPILLGVNGIWSSIVVAESAAICMTAVFMIVKRKKYNY